MTGVIISHIKNAVTRQSGWLYTALFPLLLLLSFLHFIGLLVRDVLYKTGIFRVHHFNKPVISVGNLSVGGTGKTPVAIFIAQFLLAKGYKPAILTRGYGSSRKKVPLILNGKNSAILDVKDTGDEPMMMSVSVPDVDIYIFHDRVVSAELAQQSADFLILDDGFQRYNIYRDLNILLVANAERLFGNRRVLPAGLLRDHFYNRHHAHAAVITKTNKTSAVEKNSKLEWMRGKMRTPYIFTHESAIGELRLINKSEYIPFSDIKHKKILAFCGIADPDGFPIFLDTEFRKKGTPIIVVDFIPLPDHVEYTAPVCKEILSRFRSSGAELMITTSKDAVKLRSKTEFSDNLAEVSVGCEFDDGFMNFLEQRIGQLATEYALLPHVSKQNSVDRLKS